MTDSAPHAVLTGDLIKSRQATPAAVDAAFAVLRAAAIDLGRAWDIDLRFTRYRGDGWQIVMPPALVLDTLLYFVARLRAGAPDIETRISAGIGPIDSVGTKDLSDANGAAFFLSGIQLDGMSRKRKFAIAGYGISAPQIAIIDLAEFIASSWTSAQAEAVALSLQGHTPTHDDIASDLGITRQAVQSRLAGAGISYFDNALRAMRNGDYTNQPQEK